MKQNTRQQQKKQTRELILTTAFQVFSRQGIMNTRMSDVAQAAGVSHGTIFAHFRTQEALITNVVETYGQRIALRTHELADSCGQMEEILRAHLNGIREFEPFYTRLVIENRMLPPAARDVWVSISSAISFHFSQVAAREMESGRSIRLPAHFLFNLWAGLVHYYLANGDLFAPEGAVIPRYGDALIQHYIKLIRPGREPKA